MSPILGVERDTAHGSRRELLAASPPGELLRRGRVVPADETCNVVVEVLTDALMDGAVVVTLNPGTASEVSAPASARRAGAVGFLVLEVAQARSLSHPGHASRAGVQSPALRPEGVTESRRRCPVGWWPWFCPGCGLQVRREPLGRPALHCSPACRVAAWRDRQACRSATEIQQLQASRRAARIAAPRISAFERRLIARRWRSLLPAAIRRAGLPALGDMPPGPGAATAKAIAEVSSGAANAGIWPGDQGSAEVLGEVFRRTRSALV